MVIQKCEKSKKWIFSKNWLTLFVSGREKNAHFRAHYLFWPNIFFGPKQSKAGKTTKIVVSTEIAQNQKWHNFFQKGDFRHGWRSGFYCVFEKLCFSESTIFIVFQPKTAFQKQKLYVEKTRKFMKNSGLFLNMAKWCFWGSFFWGFNAIVVCFWCVWHSCRSVKNAWFFFPNFGGFCGVAYSCLFWVWKV